MRDGLSYHTLARHREEVATRQLLSDSLGMGGSHRSVAHNYCSTIDAAQISVQGTQLTACSSSGPRVCDATGWASLPIAPSGEAISITFSRA